MVAEEKPAEATPGHGAAQAEVVVIGAGIIGLTSAIQFAKRGLRVVLIDNLEGQKQSYKVGESLLIFSNMFLRTIGDLDDFVEKSVPKKGVWFSYGAEGAAGFENASEWALESVLPQRWKDAFVSQRLFRTMINDAQIVRPEAESELCRTALAHPNITFLNTAKVKEAHISEDGGLHEVIWQCQQSDRAGMFRANWVIDCSGRNRFLARKRKHMAEKTEFADSFQTTAVWAQFSNVHAGLFDDRWAHQYKDGTKTKREKSTLHLWGHGYWIWVICLSDDRISVGATYDQKNPPPGEKLKDKFWNIIRRYRIFDGILHDENIIEFQSFKNVQHITDTFVSPHRYGMIGDAASIIDAYYSQGMSLAFVTSWHLTNIMQQDVKEQRLDVAYIDRVNRATRQDWNIMRNMIKEKYTAAIADSRFFLLSHLLDMAIFTGIGVYRHQLVRWLVETGGDPAKEGQEHRKMRETLSKRLFYSRTWSWFAPETLQRIQGGLQRKIGERARWRLDNGVRVPRIRSLVRFAAGPVHFWKLPFRRNRQSIDISPELIKSEPEFMRVTGTETVPLPVKMAKPLIAGIFLIVYLYDWASTGLSKLRGPAGKPAPEARPGTSADPAANPVPAMTTHEEAPLLRGKQSAR